MAFVTSVLPMKNALTVTAMDGASLSVSPLVAPIVKLPLGMNASSGSAVTVASVEFTLPTELLTRTQ
jgi:hypothetical protein